MVHGFGYSNDSMSFIEIVSGTGDSNGDSPFRNEWDVFFFGMKVKLQNIGSTLKRYKWFIVRKFLKDLKSI